MEWALELSPVTKVLVLLLLLPATLAARVSTDRFGGIYKGGDQPSILKHYNFLFFALRTADNIPNSRRPSSKR